VRQEPAVRRGEPIAETISRAATIDGFGKPRLVKRHRQRPLGSDLVAENPSLGAQLPERVNTEKAHRQLLEAERKRLRQADGDYWTRTIDQHQAAALERSATTALMPPKPIVVGTGGEFVPQGRAWAEKPGIVDLVRDPTWTHLHASEDRLDLVAKAQCFDLAAATADSIAARDDTERMLAHQLAAAHAAAMRCLEAMDKLQRQAERCDSLNARTKLLAEAARMGQLAARFMDTYQRGLQRWLKPAPATVRRSPLYTNTSLSQAVRSLLREPFNRGSPGAKMQSFQQPHAPILGNLNEARAAPRCGARRKKDGQPCQAPAMPNGRCRMHGGPSPGAPKGERNGNYRHGLRTQPALAERRELRQLLRQLADSIACINVL
jgi:hypothetical protein